MHTPVRLAVLLSGGGTALQNLLDRIAAGTLAAEVAVVVANKADAFGLTRARSAGIPAFGFNAAKAQGRGDRAEQPVRLWLAQTGPPTLSAIAESGRLEPLHPP